MQQQTLSKKVARNSLANLLQYVWTALITLILIPYVISRIGVERYAIWALVRVVSEYLGLADLGVGTSFIKYISEYHTRRDYDAVNKVINNGFLFYFVFGITMSIVGLAALDLIMRLINVPHDLFTEAKFVFALGIVTFMVTAMFNVFSAVINGLQRMDIYNAIIGLLLIPRVAGIVLALEGGFGLRGLIINDFIFAIVTIVVMIWQSHRLLPQLRFRPLQYDKNTMKILFRFGSKLQVSVFSTLINFQFDKLLLSRFLGLQYVTFYDLGARLLGKVRALPLVMVAAILPAASELSAKEDIQRLKEMYLRVSKYLVLLATAIFALIGLTSYEIVSLWVGEGYALTVATIQVLCIGYFLNVITGVVSFTTQGIGRPEIQMKTTALQTVLNIILSVLLVLQFGYFGAPAGTTFALAVGAVYFIASFSKVLDETLRRFFSQILLKPLLAALGSLVLVVGGWRGLIHPFLFTSSNLLLRLVVYVVLFLLFYVGMIRLLKYVDTQDRQLVISSLPLSFLKISQNR